jgi:hypothetical protein
MEPHVSQSTALRDPKVLPSEVVPEFKINNYFKQEEEKLLQEIVKFQQKKNPEKWTYFTVEEFVKSRNIDCLSKDELSVLQKLVSLGHLYKTGVYYHVSGYIVQVLDMYARKNLN